MYVGCFLAGAVVGFIGAVAALLFGVDYALTGACNKPSARSKT